MYVCLFIFKNLWCFLHTKGYHLSIFYCIWVFAIVRKPFPHPGFKCTHTWFLLVLMISIFTIRTLLHWSFPGLRYEVWIQFNLFPNNYPVAWIAMWAFYFVSRLSTLLNCSEYLGRIFCIKVHWTPHMSAVTWLKEALWTLLFDVWVMCGLAAELVLPEKGANQKDLASWPVSKSQTLPFLQVLLRCNSFRTILWNNTLNLT